MMPDICCLPAKNTLNSAKKRRCFWHPGEIEKERILHQHENFWAEYQIQSDNGVEWLVLCDLKTGKVMREQKLINGLS